MSENLENSRISRSELLISILILLISEALTFRKLSCQMRSIITTTIISVNEMIKKLINLIIETSRRDLIERAQIVSRLYAKTARKENIALTNIDHLANREKIEINRRRLDRID
jgi:hypothetical protein